MGAGQSNPVPGGGTEGYHILRVQDNSPGQKAGLEAFFDYVVAVGSTRLNQDNDTLKDILKSSVEKPLRMTVYSSKTQRVREVQIVPSTLWGGQGLLGVSIRFCSFEGANEIVWHVLDVTPGSPADLAGLRSNTDFIIGADSILHEPEDLFTLIDAHEGRALKLYVYNSDTDACREVVITPQRGWGGDGSLGCGIGYGLLHRIPIRDDPMSEEKRPQLTTTGEASYINPSGAQQLTQAQLELEQYNRGHMGQDHPQQPVMLPSQTYQSVGVPPGTKQAPIVNPLMQQFDGMSLKSPPSPPVPVPITTDGQQIPPPGPAPPAPIPPLAVSQSLTMAPNSTASALFQTSAPPTNGQLIPNFVSAAAIPPLPQQQQQLPLQSSTDMTGAVSGTTPVIPPLIPSSQQVPFQGIPPSSVASGTISQGAAPYHNPIETNRTFTPQNVLDSFNITTPAQESAQSLGAGGDLGQIPTAIPTAQKSIGPPTATPLFDMSAFQPTAVTTPLSLPGMPPITVSATLPAATFQQVFSRTSPPAGTVLPQTALEDNSGAVPSRETEQLTQLSPPASQPPMSAPQHM
ncbi:Golgi reassembly-stacking protein 2-like isoform X2 [Varroa jacobsoni]|uniref:PDZ GRASP-type domain-containing protein n=1 Tax=Varroa destructor TaxID=109461 RepID=A0A7M7KUM0_VARDE|nr:Golgi reassembly-stacking protein 2-like isoform X2 [Varroa destructor]XP_022703411.1 Golgi reassembly-stacking protein 2-like isoform X2 [Varroa jacobsoni]